MSLESKLDGNNISDNELLVLYNYYKSSYFRSKNNLRSAYFDPYYDSADSELQSKIEEGFIKIKKLNESLIDKLVQSDYLILLNNKSVRELSYLAKLSGLKMDNNNGLSDLFQVNWYCLLKEGLKPEEQLNLISFFREFTDSKPNDSTLQSVYDFYFKEFYASSIILLYQLFHKKPVINNKSAIKELFNSIRKSNNDKSVKKYLINQIKRLVD